MLSVIHVSRKEDEGFRIEFLETLNEGSRNHSEFVNKDDGRLVCIHQGFAFLSNHLVDGLVGPLGFLAQFMRRDDIVRIDESSVIQNGVGLARSTGSREKSILKEYCWRRKLKVDVA